MNTINQENSQDITPEEAKASLGVGNRLMEELLTFQGLKSDIDGSSPRIQEAYSQDREMEQNQMMEEPMEETEDIGEKFEQFKEEINKTIDDRFNQLGEMIREALSEEDDE